MAELPGDPNWLLSTVVLAGALTLVLFACVLLARGLSTAGHRRAIALRRMEIDTMIQLRTLHLNQLKAELATVATEGNPASSINRRRSQASSENELAAAELAVLESEGDRLEAASGNLDSSGPSWFGVFVLGYLAVVGILMPLALMPARSGAFDPSAIWSLGGLELSGLTWKRLVIVGFAGGLGLALLEVTRATIKGKTWVPDSRHVFL